MLKCFSVESVLKTLTIASQNLSKYINEKNKNRDKYNFYILFGYILFDIGCIFFILDSIDLD